MHTLRLFYDVATLRSFSQAAGRHGVTQSAASQRVSQLEKKLGVTLVDRSVRPLVLTAAGEEYLRGCRQVLERYDRLERRVAKLKPELAGSVRVDAIYSAGIDLLNHVKELFEQQNPKVTVVVDYKRPEMVYEAVRSQQCDMGILSYPRSWRDVGVIALRNEPMGVVCSPTHPLAAHKRIHASQLAGWPMVTFESDLPVGRRLNRYLRNHGVTPKVANVFDNIDTIKSAVAMTDTFAILPQRTVLREVEAGTLALVELEPELVRPIGIIYHRPRGGSVGAFSPAAQAFVDFLLAHAGPKVDLGKKVRQGSIERETNLVGAKS